MAYYFSSIAKEALDYTNFRKFASNIGINLENSEVALHTKVIFDNCKKIILTKYKNLQMDAAAVRRNPLFNQEYLKYVPVPLVSEELVQFQKVYASQTMQSQEHISNVVAEGGIELEKENTQVNYDSIDIFKKETFNL